MNIDGIEVNDLYDDVKEGVLLNKVLDHIQPGSVNWKMICKTKISQFDAQGNNSVFVDNFKKNLGVPDKLIQYKALAKGDKLAT